MAVPEDEPTVPCAPGLIAPLGAPSPRHPPHPGAEGRPHAAPGRALGARLLDGRPPHSV
ncbi:hypothetical protein ACSP97_30025 [Streptomyces sp. SCPE 10]|uniref:hypothetical protein n=1 Tax=Streptomyces sp. SCPE 10 TaxID=3449273 RepID=UPI003F7E45F7